VTEEEARKLWVGAVVEARFSGVWVKVMVVGFEWFEAAPGLPAQLATLRVRRPGKTRKGRHFASWRKTLYNVRPYAISDLDPTTSNVYADWLDDHGEPGAARKLREAFPLPPG
jgi:hypothetical protein